MKHILNRFMFVDEVFDTVYGHHWTINMRKGGSVLGMIRFQAHWNQYVFQPEDMTEFSADCLDRIRTFLVKINGKEKV